MSSDKKPLQALVLMGVITLAVSAGLLLVARQRVLTLRNIQGDVASTRQSIRDAKALIAQIPKLQEEVDVAKERIAFYEAVLPAEEEVPRLYKKLDERAQRHSIRYMKVGQYAEVPGSEFTTYKQQIALRAGYHELGSYLADIETLEKMERLIQVDSLSIESDVTDPTNHQVNLIVSTFVAKKKLKEGS